MEPFPTPCQGTYLQEAEVSSWIWMWNLTSLIQDVDIFNSVLTASLKAHLLLNFFRPMLIYSQLLWYFLHCLNLCSLKLQTYSNANQRTQPVCNKILPRKMVKRRKESERGKGNILQMELGSRKALEIDYNWAKSVKKEWRYVMHIVSRYFDLSFLYSYSFIMSHQ